MAAAVNNSNNTKLQGKSLTVRVEPVERKENVYVANNSNISMWTFNPIASASEENLYFITTVVKDELKYLRIGEEGISLVSQGELDAACRITITAGTGNRSGKYKLTSGSSALSLNGTQFVRVASTTSNDSVWMDFAELSNLNDDDFVVYKAHKVSVSGTADENGDIDYDVKNGDQVILYTRIWNDTTLRYEYFAVDHDGKLVKAYDEGDTISWVGSKINTLLWDFSEYYYEGTSTPNYYYDLQNAYSGKYIAPQVTGDSFLSDEKIGINLNGRRYNEYYSTILAWDAPYYDYASLKAEDYQLVSAAMSKADDFYFAKMVLEEDDNKLTTVSTVDNNEFGISVKMQNYPYQGYFLSKGYRSSYQADVLGVNSERDGNKAYSGLLTRNLGEDGYPTTTAAAASAGGQNGTSLRVFYDEAIDANHQFLTGTYNETGYFEYDCTQNFAHLITNENDKWIGKEMPGGGTYGIGDFVVYDQIGTSELSAKATLQHGQFLPYNDLTDGVYSKQNPTNLTDLRGDALSSLDPRKGEKLYGIAANSNEVKGTPEKPKFAPDGHVDYFFGMEMSADFMQSANGLDAWGHDLIFEFSGDDDFWLYVDGMLVMDLGGVHSAINGSVNFRTGIVTYIDDKGATKTTTLRALYEAAYKELHPSASAGDISGFLNGYFKDGTSIFKDYSGHSMKMFYMERGSSASNLHMRFNLVPYTGGEVLLQKEVTGTENADMEFPFQIWYEEQMPEGLQYVTWGQTDEQRAKVVDTQNDDLAKYEETYTVDGLTYENVFFLKAGQTVSIHLPDENAKYYIKECALDTDTFDEVRVNGEVLEGTEAGADDEVLEGTEAGADGSADSGNGQVSNRKDYTITESEVSGRKKVIYENHVSDAARKTLTITKRLWEDDERTYEIPSGSAKHADNTEFTFRIYIGKDANGNYTAYNTGKYYVKDPEGNYCMFHNGGFESTGKSDLSEFSTVAPDDKTKSELEAITFYASPNGAIERIRAGYSVEIPGLLDGTPFLVEERDEEIPDGYKLLGYSLTEGAYSSDNLGEDTGSGVINAELENQTVSVHNQHGFGLSAKKVWSDAAFMESHDPIYFAVYLKGSYDQPVAETVRQIAHPKTSVRWFFPELLHGKTLNDYEVYEVELTGDVEIDEDGVVSGYDSITLKNVGDSIEVGGTDIEDDHTFDSSSHVYSVDYNRELLTEEELENGANHRTDIVTNSRQGIRLVKTDMDGKALAGAVFELGDFKAGSKKTFISDENGLIAVAYLMPDKDYTLKEVEAPEGYSTLIDEMTIRVDLDNVVYVNGSKESSADGYYTVEQAAGGNAADAQAAGEAGANATDANTAGAAADGTAGDNTNVGVASMGAAMPTITIKNIDHSLKARKIDSSTGLPMQGVVFSLYKDVVVSNAGASGTASHMPDYRPMEGYEQLETDENGIIPGIVLKNADHPDGLKPGIYYLREETPLAYKPLGFDIRITISATGEVTLESAVRPAQQGAWKFGNISKDVAEVVEEGSGAGTGAGSGEGSGSGAGAGTGEGTISRSEKTIVIKNTPKEPIRIRKLETGTMDHKLANVKFELYKAGQIDTATGRPVAGETPVQSGTTDSEGLLNLAGLEDGISYYLYETEPAPGYNGLEAPVILTSTTVKNVTTITATMDGAELSCKKVKTADKKEIWEITIYNTPGDELPSTGGSGTLPFMLAGMALMLLAAFGALALRRRRA